MPPRRIQVGEATVTVLNLGDLRLRLRDMVGLPESEWRPRYGELFDQPLLFPSQSVHISTPDASILVDAGNYALFAALEPSCEPENYTPPPPLTEQLARIGVGTRDITHVVITHAHYDHFAGVTTEVAGKYSATFPRARYMLGRGDWDAPEMRRALGDPTSPESTTLGELESSGLLEITEGERRLTSAVSTIASPGESPGHRIVRVSSNGDTLYCLGDLFHHAVEVEDLRLMSRWCDPVTNRESRRALITASLIESALLVPAHMPPGRLSGTAGRPRFDPV